MKPASVLALCLSFISSGADSAYLGRRSSAGLSIPVTHVPQSYNYLSYNQRREVSNALVQGSITTDVNLQGNFPSIGEYFFTIYVDEKPFFVQLDTGSSDFGVSGKPSIC